MRNCSQNVGSSTPSNSAVDRNLKHFQTHHNVTYSTYKSCEKSQKELATENLGFTAIDVALWEKKNAEEEEEDEGSTESGKAAAHFMNLSPPRWQPATWQRSRRFYLRFSFSFHVARHYRTNSQSYKATVHMSLTNWDSSPVSSPTHLCHPPR
ncbi:unnamed protein product [Sphagnum jensenii]|uniref:Uncharacterized protein n=1 Tax=Sphagnum jensenii TaxID=128206 RepID=A0ABP1C3E3_9BRYO